MMLKCGPSLVQRLESRYRRKRDWHRWFAWYPVRINDGMCIWFEWVEAKNTGPACLDGWDEWEYRLPKESPP
jgi:hypothetical protein